MKLLFLVLFLVLWGFLDHLHNADAMALCKQKHTYETCFLAIR